MRLYTTRVSSKGQVTIPKPLRDRLDLEQGDFLVMESHGDEIRVRKTSTSVEDFDALAERHRRPFPETRDHEDGGPRGDSVGQREGIVCDTNVLVSALGWKGPERRLYDACRREQVRLVTSGELLQTLHYPKLGFSEDEIAAFRVDVRAHAGLVRPDVEVSVIAADPDDDRGWSAR